MQVLEGRLAEMIFESASKKIQDVKFLIDLLSIAKEYNFTDKLQSKMVEYVFSFGSYKYCIYYLFFLNWLLASYDSKMQLYTAQLCTSTLIVLQQ